MRLAPLYRQPLAMTLPIRQRRVDEIYTQFERTLQPPQHLTVFTALPLIADDAACPIANLALHSQ